MGGDRCALGAPSRHRPCPDSADRPRGGGGAARLAGGASRPGGPPPPRHGDRPGRRGQVAAAARADVRRSTREEAPPTIRRGQCPPYGAGIAYWALAEVLNDEFEIRDTDAPEAAWEKLRSGVTSLMSELGDRVGGRAQRRPAGDPAGPRASRGASPLGGRPAADARGALLRRPRRRGGDRKPAAAGAGDRRHPLGRRGDARPDRPPDALGAGPLLLVCLARDELLERRPGWGGGRRNATTIALEPLTENETRELVASAAAGGRQRDGGRRSAGRRALRRQPAVRRGDGQPPARGGDGRGRRAAEHRPVAACGPPRLARPARAEAAPIRLGGRADLLGGRAGLHRGAGGPRSRRTLANARGEGPAGPERRAPAWPASASTPSSTS